MCERGEVVYERAEVVYQRGGVTHGDGRHDDIRDRSPGVIRNGSLAGSGEETGGRLVSQNERRIADTQGRFVQIVEGGRENDDARWTTGRVLLSNRRLLLVGKQGKRTLPLSEIDRIEGRNDVNQAVTRVANYTSLRMGEDVVLLSTQDHDSFEVDLFSALLDGEVLLVRHPAVEGGVVQETEWEKAKVNAGEDGTINVGTTEGNFVGIELDDVTHVGVGERTVLDQPKRVVEVEHSEGGTSVETYLAGPARACSFLKTLLARGVEENSGEFDLDATEKQVLMALYSGVSSFEIPQFTGVEVGEVEETFERLVELEILDEVRVRREVALTPRGRNLASEAISDE